MKLEKSPSGTYHVSFFGGKGIVRKVSTDTKDFKQAKERARLAGVEQIELAARAGVLTQKVVSTIIRGNQKLTLEGVLEEWKSWMAGVSIAPRTAQSSYETARAFIRTMGLQKELPMNVSETSVGSFVNRTGDLKASTRTVALAALRRFFDWMQANNYCDRNPARLVRVDWNRMSHEQKEPTERQPITPAEYSQILAVVDAKDDPFWKTATRVGRITALRLGDIAALEWATFAREGYMTVWTMKRDKRVQLPMTDDLLLNVIQIPRDDAKYCFPHIRSLAVDPTTRAQLSVQFMRICAKAKVTGKSFHCLRHSRATEIYEQTGSVEAVREALGHADTKTSEGYIHHE